jgi:excisionase family DNA binding protein
MLIVSPSTASALAPHAAERSWVMFVQVNPPGGGQGPIKIEAVKGSQIGTRLATLARENAFDPMLIGLIESPTPLEHAQAIIEQYAAGHLHHDWYAPSADLLAYIQHVAQGPIQALLAETHPGGLSEESVEIEEMADILNVSVPTVRRMIKQEVIPYLKFGRIYRFVPADVIASLARRTR